MGTPRPRRPTVGIVLGAGGVLGAAWMTGALVALQQRLDRPVHDADVIVGTSAGSILAAALRCAVPLEDLLAHQRGATFAQLPHLADLDRDSGRLPPWPRLRLGSPKLLVNAAMAPHRVHFQVAASALLPRGRARHQSLTQLMHALLPPAHGRKAPTLDWPANRTWIICVDYESGRRVAFGRPGAPPASLPDAVVASCSIPGWHEPMEIGDRRYVDGGVRSATSVELLATAALDVVYVLAPMASYQMDRPRNPALRAERLVRQWVTNGLTREIAKVEATGTKVIAVTPGPEDLAVMGINAMDWTRRQRVLETSLQTSPGRLAALDPRQVQARAGSPSAA